MSGTGLISEPYGNAALTGGPDQNAPTALYPASVWDQFELAGTSQQILRGIGSAAATYGTFDDYGRPASPPDPYIPAADLNASYEIPGELHFSNPAPESVAQGMYEQKRAELARRDAASRSDAGFLTRFAAGLAASAPDPLNVLAGLVPVIGEARVMGWMARAGIEAGPLATAGARYGAGMIGAGTAQLPLTGLHYALSRQEQADYSASDAMADVVMGSLFGGGLHVASGGIRDAIGSSFARSAVARLAGDSPEAREQLARAAIAQVAQGAPVNLGPILDTTALRSAYAERLAAAGGIEAGNYPAYAPNGQRIELHPEVVEADTLITSHQDDGTANPAYPHEAGLQPRDRTSLASQEQVGKIAAQLIPEQLGPSPDAAAGAPIVNQAGAVESGNGRVAALRRVHSDPQLTNQAAAYRSYLEARGHDLTGMRAPILIGRRVSDMTPEELRSFTRSANERATLGMSAAEQARADASRAAAAIGEYVPGPLAGAGNESFIGAFMAQLPPEERGAMLLANGELSAPGEARIRQALLAHAYGDALGPSLERILNGDVEHMKAVAGALTDAAGMWSRLRAAAAAGEIPAGLDITPAIGEAVQILDRARAAKTPIGEYVANLQAQGDLIGGPSPAAIGLLRLMFQDEAMRRPVARPKLAAMLDGYVRQALEAKPGPNLFGDPETTAADIMRVIGRGDARTEAAADGLTIAPEEQAGAMPERPTPTAPAERMTSGKVQRRDGVGYNEAKRRADAENAAADAEDAGKPAAAEAPAEAPGEAPNPDQGGLFGDEPATPEATGEPGAAKAPAEAPGEAPEGETPRPAQPEARAESPPGETPRGPGEGAPPEITQQADNLARDLADLADANPEVAAELARITEEDDAAQSVLGAIKQAGACLFGGLGL